MTDTRRYMISRRTATLGLTCLGIALSAEVSLAQNLVNVAQDKPTQQSTTLGGYPSSNGVDGNLGNFTHTDGTDDNPWWEVDLGQSFVIDSIVLNNRDSCCQDRLRDVTVDVKDGGGTPLFTSDVLNPGGTMGGNFDLTLDFDPAQSGQIIRVTRNVSAGSGNVLSLGEVQVFVELPGIDLVVNRSTGMVTMANNSGRDFNIDFYQINSASGSLTLNGWNSLQDQDFEGNGSPGGGDGWEEAGGSGTHSVAEAYLQGDSLIGDGQTVALGNIFNAAGGTEDIEFFVRDALGAPGIGSTAEMTFVGAVSYEGVGGIVLGDMDGSGNVDAFDVPAFELALADKQAYIASYPGIDPDVVGDIDGSGALDAFDVPDFETLLASIGGSSTVPEPATLTLLGLAGLAAIRRRR